MSVLTHPRRPWLRAAAALLFAALLLPAPLQVQAANPPILVVPLKALPSGTYPAGLLYGPLASVWLTEPGTGSIGRLGLDRSLETFPLTSPSSAPFDLALGADEHIWFTERQANSVARLEPDGTITEYAVPTPGSSPSQMALGQDGSLWFTEYQGNRIGRVATSGQIDEVALPQPGSQPLGIASALDGSLWFTEWGANRVGRMTLAGEVTEYPLSGASSRPTEIVLGPDGNLWLLYSMGKQLTRLDPDTGQMDQFSLATVSQSLADLAVGADGRLWFLGTGSIGWMEVTPAGPANLVEVPLSPVFEGNGRSQLVAGPGVEMYFIRLSGSGSSQAVYQAIPNPASVLLRPDLQVFFTQAPSTVLAAGGFELTADLVNWSGSTATGVALELTLGANLQFLSAAGEVTCTASGQQVHCLPSRNLVGGATLPVTFHLKADRVDGVTRELSLQVQAAQDDLLPANNRTFRTVRIQRSFDYFNDFSDSAEASLWSETTLRHVGGLSYLGSFDNREISFSLSHLPAHDRARVCFDLYILGPWDGSAVAEVGGAPIIGPDLWASYMDGEPVWVTTFSNVDRLPQAYPYDYLEGEMPARSGASAVGSFDGGAAADDTRYTFCTEQVHAAPTLTAVFYGLHLNPAEAEAWALDNVRVDLYYHDAYEWIYLPLTIR